MFVVPPLVFQIVWPILYVLLFLSMVLFYIKPTSSKTIILLWSITFWFGIVLNGLWYYYYFQQKNRTVSYVLFLFLILLAFATLVLSGLSSQQYRWATFALFLPYFLWLVFAFYYFITN